MIKLTVTTSVDYGNGRFKNEPKDVQFRNAEAMRQYLNTLGTRVETAHQPDVEHEVYFVASGQTKFINSMGTRWWSKR